MISGGYLKDVPLPHHRMYCDPPTPANPRPVRIRLRQYYGAGGDHFYVCLEEDFNPVWDVSTNEYHKGRPYGWREAWDDRKGRGKKVEPYYRFGKFKTIGQVKRFLHLAKLLIFPGPGWVFTDPYDSLKFHGATGFAPGTFWYDREGD